MRYQDCLQRAIAKALERQEEERGHFSSDPLFAPKRRQQNLFDPMALRSARDEAARGSNAAIVQIAEEFLRDHDRLLGRLCRHPNCLQPIQQNNGGRGRPKLFHSRACQEALAAWIARRERQGANWSALPWKDLDSQPSRVRGGRKGFRAALRRFNPWWGLESALGPELRSRLHEVYLESGAAGVNKVLSEAFGRSSEWREAQIRPENHFP
ncbi:MAG TPA: hypothetical protein VGF98_05000 [Candidatus Tumulicola sp.]|jgi:hypothetical protein